MRFLAGDAGRDAEFERFYEQVPDSRDGTSIAESLATQA
jgi:hypothetical protein